MTSSTVEARAPATWWGHPVVQRHAPVIVIVLVLIALWYIATVLANATLVREAFERSETSYTTFDLISGTLSAERPLVVAPHQMLLAFWNSVSGYPPSGGFSGPMARGQPTGRAVTAP